MNPANFFSRFVTKAGTALVLASIAIFSLAAASSARADDELELDASSALPGEPALMYDANQPLSIPSETSDRVSLNQSSAARTGTLAADAEVSLAMSGELLPPP